MSAPDGGRIDLCLDGPGALRLDRYATGRCTGCGWGVADGSRISIEHHAKIAIFGLAASALH